MHPATNEEEAAHFDAKLTYLNTEKPIDSLLSVIEEALKRKGESGVFERNTAKRLLRDVVFDGYDIYLIALALEFLIANEEGKVLIGKVCSIPAIMAGMTWLDVDKYTARYEYWYRYANDKKKYVFWMYRLQDALEVGDEGMIETAKKKLNSFIGDC